MAKGMKSVSIPDNFIFEILFAHVDVQGNATSKLPQKTLLDGPMFEDPTYILLGDVPKEMSLVRLLDDSPPQNLGNGKKKRKIRVEKGNEKQCSVEGGPNHLDKSIIPISKPTLQAMKKCYYDPNQII
ncbi:hypothetical protein HAX54_041683 [Datura stramonium]|uniref:Uncharacterized protein n=1 Tax=Datura stramonium TaxID=4076 RepID=A0ABS8SLM9_DATST|nr:hypothetical protein [Datura stramonium]